MPQQAGLKGFLRSVNNFFTFNASRESIALAPQGNLYGGMLSLNPEEEYKKGLKKPGVSFKQLRTISRSDAVIRICINAIKKAVSQSEWKIACKKGEGDPKVMEKWDTFFSLVNSNGENLRSLLDRVLEDILSLDAGVIEKVYNFQGDLMELVSVDGSTIRPVYNKYGELDPEGAYVQYIGSNKVATFKANEIIYIMQSPQNDIERFGYGMSPIESIIMTVVASMNAELYNAKAFSTDNIPPGMIDLGDVGTPEAKQFIDLWDASVQTNNRKLRFIWGGKDVKNRYIPFVQNHKDMQFVEYTDWLSRLKLANYGLTGMDANITQDVNRATAWVQQNISESRGVQSIKHLLEEYFYRELFVPAGDVDYVFEFEKTQNIEQKKKQAEIDKIYVEVGALDPAQIADREGFDTTDMDSGEQDYDGVDVKPKPKEGVVDPEDDKKKMQKHFKALY